MRNNTKDHSRSPHNCVGMVALSLLFLLSTLYSQENNKKNFQIMVGVTGGVSKLRYDDINRQLAKHNQYDGLSSKDNPYGLAGMVIYKNRVIIDASVLHYTEETRVRENYPQWGVSLSRLSLELKMGITHTLNTRNIIFPYIGLDFATMSADNQYSYTAKDPYHLFHSSSETKVVSNLALIYGIGYTRLPKAKYGIGIGMELGGSFALTDHVWYEIDERLLIPWFDSRKVHPLVRSEEHVRFDPGGYFVRANIYFRLF